MSYTERLLESIKSKNSPVLMGLDPRTEQIPEDCFSSKEKDPEIISDAFLKFGMRLIDCTKDKIAAIKPQIAFYEALGLPGLKAYAETLAYAESQNVITISDIKRGDIGSTSEAYAQAHLGSVDGNTKGPFEADAITINPWLGKDSIDPYLERCKNNNKGIYLLLHTSNPGSKDIQELNLESQKQVYQQLSELIINWQSDLNVDPSPIGVVFGATFPEQLQEMIKVLGETPLLIPGYGAQGGTGESMAFLFRNRTLGPHLVNASRSITYAYIKENCTLEEGAINAITAMQKDLVG